MKYISLIFQSLLRIGLIWFLSFVWSRYFFSQLWISLLVSFGITVIIELLLRFFAKKKDKRSNLKLKEKEEAENMFLSLSTDPHYLDFFLRLAQKEMLNSEKKKDYILMHTLKSTTLLYPILTLNSLLSDDIKKALQVAEQNKAEKAIIICGEVSKEAQTLANSLDFNLIILDKFSTYNDIYKYYDTFPQITTRYKKSKKLTLKELFAYSFNRSRTKGYFLSAFVLFVSTLFVKLNIYYCIMSSVLLLFAILSYINPYFNHNTSKQGLG